jgi:DNA-binding response OmpR family regulator
MVKVLLVEDDPTMLTLLNTLLEIEGHVVSILESFDNIVEDVRSYAPDVILMDVHLQDIDGIEILETIRKENELSDIKVIMSSGMDLNEESLSKGADGFLLKPYMPDELFLRINQFTNET